MRRIFKTVDDHLTECTTLEKGCWVHLQNPTREEIDGLNTRFALDPTYLAAALDEEESARIEHEGDQTLIIVDIPYVESEGSGYIYSTIPLGIVLVDDIIITVCTRDTPIIADFTQERVRNFWTFKRTRFILQLLHRNASRFLAYLKQIDKSSMHVQEKLEKSSRVRGVCPALVYVQWARRKRSPACQVSTWTTRLPRSSSSCVSTRVSSPSWAQVWPTLRRRRVLSPQRIVLPAA